MGEGKWERVLGNYTEPLREVGCWDCLRVRVGGRSVCANVFPLLVVMDLVRMDVLMGDHGWSGYGVIVLVL